MSYPIIGLAGNAGVGKDYIADLIVKNSYKCQKIALADELKEILFTLGVEKKYLWGKSELRNKIIPESKQKTKHRTPFGFWENLQFTYLHLPIDRFTLFRDLQKKHPKGVSARILLQELGHELRKTNPNYLTNKVNQKITALLSKDVDLVVVTDLRYRSEILFFKSLGAKIYQIESPQGSTVSGKLAQHPSEQELATVPNDWYDGHIWNDKDSEERFLTQHLQTVGIL